jgi:hypothetical protein
MAFTLPIRLQDLDKVPSITANVRNMLMEHPKVYLETEMPRCHVTKVGGLSIELTISCNLKPMVSLWALMWITLVLHNACLICGIRFAISKRVGQHVEEYNKNLGLCGHNTCYFPCANFTFPWVSMCHPRFLWLFTYLVLQISTCISST